MSDSFTEKLYRLKSTCDERTNRITDVKQEIQHEKEQINTVLKNQISDLQVISLKYQTTNLQLELGLICLLTRIYPLILIFNK